eukprot:TRINITY_DN2272_c0_g1_i3.p3 TRINITY_DN2272_c0_g1~~TRINITY_DN2272_c0_g1_i3.p3  ORF type:complete len:139 (+),score=70.91 TRINITY_DN2272_c0_g1_i3:86-502(+)
MPMLRLATLALLGCASNGVRIGDEDRAAQAPTNAMMPDPQNAPAVAGSDAQVSAGSHMVDDDLQKSTAVEDVVDAAVEVDGDKKKKKKRKADPEAGDEEDGEKEDGEKNDDEKKDGEKKDGEKKDGEKKGEEGKGQRW